jgi:hypothetical protein
MIRKNLIRKCMPFQHPIAIFNEIDLIGSAKKAEPFQNFISSREASQYLIH